MYSTTVLADKHLHGSVNSILVACLFAVVLMSSWVVVQISGIISSNSRCMALGGIVLALGIHYWFWRGRTTLATRPAPVK